MFLILLKVIEDELFFELFVNKFVYLRFEKYR